MAAHAADVTGVIGGFDRLRLRASLRWLYQPSFMKRYLCEARVLLKDFGGYATALSNQIRAAAHFAFEAGNVAHQSTCHLQPSGALAAPAPPRRGK